MTGQDGRPLVYVVSTGGQPNFGDELITSAWVDYFAERLPEAELWLDTKRPGATQALLEGRHPRLRSVDTLWQVCSHAPSDDPWVAAEFASRSTRDHGLVCRNEHGLRILERADLILIAGGGYIHSTWGRHVGLVAAVHAIRTRTGTPVAMTGAGLVPADHATAVLLSEILAKFDLVEVRDSVSQGIANTLSANARLGLDDAFLARPERLVGGLVDAEVVLCLQIDTVDASAAQLAGFALNVLHDWGVDRERIAYVECLPPDDRRIFDLLAVHLPSLRFVPFSELWDTGMPARAGQLWLSTRFHPHLIAASTGAVGLAVAARRGYYDVKHQSLIDLGTGWTLVQDLSEAPPAPDPHDAFATTVHDLRRRKRTTADAVLAFVT